MALQACPRPECISCQIERLNGDHLSFRNQRNVHSVFDRHQLPNPLKDIDQTSLQQWAQGVEERIMTTYGDEVYSRPQVFNPARATGIAGHIQQINQELSRADYSAPNARLSDVEKDVAKIQIPEVLNGLFEVARGVSEAAKRQVNWQANGAQPQECIIFFPVIGKALAMV